MYDIRRLQKLESSGTLTTAGVKDRFIFPVAGELVNTAIVVGTAPTGANLIVDILLNGTTVYSTTANRPTIVAGSLVQTQANRDARPDVTRFAAGDVLSLVVSQIGSTVAGADLDATVQYTTA